MTIVALHRVILAGFLPDKAAVLDELQRRGWLQLIPSADTAAEAVATEPNQEGLEALKFLLACPQRQRPVLADTQFDAVQVATAALRVQKTLADLEEERDELQERLAAAQPWGEFEFPPLAELGGQRLWFYAVPHPHLAACLAAGYPTQVVGRTGKLTYLVVVHPEEPADLPVPRVHLGSRSPRALATRLAEVEQALTAARAERVDLTRWSWMLAQNLNFLEDRATRQLAEQWTCDRGELFAVEAWAPREHQEALKQFAAERGLVFSSRPPRPDEQPPTMLRNPTACSAGEDLVNFYMTPGYWTWDPSGIVFYSFAIFFAMILADAGYAALLGLGLLLGWRRLGASAGGRRMRPLLTWIVGLSLVFGVLVGSYFGVTPPATSWLGRLHLLDMNNSGMMMGLSVLVGAAHVILANVQDARRRSDWREACGPLGWALAIAGGVLAAAGAVFPSAAILKPLGGVLAVGGLLLVLGFTAPHERFGSRLLQGVLGLTKISAAFGDILSYLRLFALGLASASLAVAFNEMAAGIRSSVPGIGFLLALLILVFGHALNLLLGISSGVIHGLRLNVIEFFNWGLKEEGRRFQPFQRKEGSTWK